MKKSRVRQELIYLINNEIAEMVSSKYRFETASLLADSILERIELLGMKPPNNPVTQRYEWEYEDKNET